MYPRDKMEILWKLIIKFHKKAFPNLIFLVSLALTCPTNTADCEQSFSVQNYINTQRRASLSAERCDQLKRLCICGHKLNDMDFTTSIKLWQKKVNRLLYAKKQDKIV